MSQKCTGADHEAGPCQQKKASGCEYFTTGCETRASPEALNDPDHIKGILSDEQNHIAMLRQFQNEVWAMQEDVCAKDACLSDGSACFSPRTPRSLQEATEESEVLRMKLETSEKKLQDFQKSARELQHKVELLERAKIQCAKEAASCTAFLKKQMDDFVSSAECMRQEAQDTRGELEKHIFVLEAEKNDSEAQVLHMQHAVPEEEYYALQRQLHEAEQERREAATKQESAEAHVQLLSGERVLLQGHCVQLVDFARRIEVEKDMEQARTVAYFEDQLANAKSEIASLSSERASLQGHCAQVVDHAKLIEVAKDMEQARTVTYFEDQLANAKAEIVQLQQDLAEAMKKCHLSEARLERQAAVAAHRQQKDQETIADLRALIIAHNSATKEQRNKSEKRKAASHQAKPRRSSQTGSSCHRRK